MCYAQQCALSPTPPYCTRLLPTPADDTRHARSRQIVTLKPRTNPVDLTRIFRMVAKNVLEDGGIVRAVTNHGIRVLPYRFHSKHNVSDHESRWFTSGRWVSAYYDVNPSVAKRMEVGVRWGGGGLLKRILQPNDNAQRPCVSKYQRRGGIRWVLRESKTSRAEGGV